MKSLTIGCPYIERNRLCAEISLDGNDKKTLWYEVSEEYVPYLCSEKSDAFLVNLLLYAMENRYNIICENYVSERLYYQITEYLIPSVSQNIDTYKPISITADLSSEVLSSAHAVGGSISGGVDSFYTALKHMNRKEENYNITHYAFFNAGASGMYGGDEARKVFKSRIEWIKQVAEDQGKPIVIVDTNFNEFLHQNHLKTHTFRSLAIPLALQKLYSVYYYSSSVPFTEFAITEYATGSYDLLSLNCLNTENIVFYPHGGEVSRLMKLEFISTYPVTYKYLNVCVREDVNCCKCEKCRRTMAGLYLLGKLNKYSNVFDLKTFNADKRKIIYEAIKRKEEHDWKDIYKAFKETHEINVVTIAMSKAYFKLKKILLNNNSFSSFYTSYFYYVSEKRRHS